MKNNDGNAAAMGSSVERMVGPLLDVEQSLNRLEALVNAAQDSTRIAGLFVGRLLNRLYAQDESEIKSCMFQPESETT